MNFSKKNLLSCQQSTKWEEQSIEKEVDYFNQQLFRFEKKNIQIKFTSDQKVIYFLNGIVFKVVEYQDVLEKPEIFQNIYQIHNLSWQGKHNQNKKKDGKWIVFWNKVPIKDVGGQSYIIMYNLYYKDGQKQGLWKDLFQNYWDWAKRYEIGEYYNGCKIGKWSDIYVDKKIGGGFYINNNQKQGKWITPDERFYCDKQVTHNGEYKMNGMKVGKWEIMFCLRNEIEYKSMGNCGYLVVADYMIMMEIRKRLESGQNQMKGLKEGEYNMQGLKIGRWDSMYCVYGEKEYKQIGGGSYDQDGNQKKIGKWVELDEGFKGGNDHKQVTYKGEYNMQGMKIGRWDSLQDNYKIGGTYDQDGNQKKIGMWVELDDGFNSFKQVTCGGEYNMQGMKIGRWDSMYCVQGEKEYKQIGGGSYDQDGNQKKIGKWVELDEGFKGGNDHKQVTYKGEYNMQGIKIGRWDSMYCVYGEKEYKQIGGGSYNYDGNQKKIGKWIELDEGFKGGNDHIQVTYKGEYNMQGLKIGRWDSMYCVYGEKEYKQIGGGSYDQDGNQKKVGKWVELDDGFNSFQQVTYNGEYNMQGIKIGRWDSMYCVYGEKEYKQIGGGLYDQDGNQKKIGKWVELDEWFCNWKQVTYNGEYNMQGLKIGIWKQINIK